jgi:hypothetical protein
MHIIEQFVQGKISDESCEDGIVVTNDYAAVIDGASAKSDFTINGLTTGKYIMLKLKEIIPWINPWYSAEEFVDEINKKLIHIYKEEDIYDVIREDCNKVPSASLTVYSKHHHEVWLFADGQLLAGGIEYKNELKVDEIMQKARKWMIEYYLATGKTEEELLEFDLAREHIQPFLKTQYIFNGNNTSEFGYSSINGFSFLMKDAKIIQLKPNVSEIVLSSDGYPKLFSTLEETEGYLQECLKEDPLCYKRIVSTKGLKKGQRSYDDRSYLRVSLTK